MWTQHCLLLGLLLILTKNIKGENIQDEYDVGTDYSIYRTAHSSSQISATPGNTELEQPLKGTTLDLTKTKSPQNKFTKKLKPPSIREEILKREIYPDLFRLFDGKEMELSAFNTDSTQMNGNGIRNKSSKDMPVNSEKISISTEQHNNTQKEQSDPLIHLLNSAVLEELLADLESEIKFNKSLGLDVEEKNKNFTIRKYEGKDEQNTEHGSNISSESYEKEKKALGFNNSAAVMNTDKYLTLRRSLNKSLEGVIPIDFPRIQTGDIKSPSLKQLSGILTNGTKVKARLVHGLGFGDVDLEGNEFKTRDFPKEALSKTNLHKKRDILDIIYDLKDEGQSSAKKAVQFAEEIPSKLPALSDRLRKIFKRQERDVLNITDDIEDKSRKNSSEAVKTDAKIVKLSREIINEKLENGTDKGKNQDYVQKNSSDMMVTENKGLTVHNRIVERNIHVPNKTNNYSAINIIMDKVEEQGKGIEQSHEQNRINVIFSQGIENSNGTMKKRELKNSSLNLNKMENMTLLNSTGTHKTELNTISQKITSMPTERLRTMNTVEKLTKNFSNLTMERKTMSNSANDSLIKNNNEIHFINTTDNFDGSSSIINSTVEKFHKLLNANLSNFRQKRSDHSFEIKSHKPDYFEYKMVSQNPDNIKVEAKTHEPVNEEILTEDDVKETILDKAKNVMKMLYHFSDAFRDLINDQPLEGPNSNVENENRTVTWIMTNDTKALNRIPIILGSFEYFEQVHLVNENKTKPMKNTLQSAPHRFFLSKSRTHPDEQDFLPHDAIIISRDLLCNHSRRPIKHCRQVCRLRSYGAGICSKWGYCFCFGPIN